MKARDLFREIARAAWECADPGMQFDTTINRWHTAANTGRINGSNPCFTADTLVHTDKGLIRFGELFDRANKGEEFGVYTHDVTNVDAPTAQVVLTTPEAFMITGRNPIVRLRFDNGMELRCTPGHRIFTTNRGYVEAQHLTADDQVRTLDLPTPAVNADWTIPVSSDPADYRQSGDHAGELRLPSTWTEEVGHYLGWLIGDGSTAGATTSTIYGSADDRTEILPAHTELLTWINGDRPIKLSEQANGTAQLRLARRQFKKWLEALGVRSVTGEHKVVPWSIEQAPPAIAASFLRGSVRRRRHGRRQQDEGQLRRARVDLGRAPARRAAPADHLRHLESDVPGARWRHRDAAGQRPHADGVHAAAELRPAHHVGFDRALRGRDRLRAEREGGSPRRDRLVTGAWSVRRRDVRAADRAQRRGHRAHLQPERAPQPQLRRRRHRRAQLLRVHAPRQQRVQSGQPQPARVPRRRRRVRRRGLQGGGRGRVHRAGDPRRQRRLPDREDRRHVAQVPSARSRLREPRRAAHGARHCRTTPTPAGRGRARSPR